MLKLTVLACFYMFRESNFRESTMAFGDSTVNNNTTPISVNVSNQQALPNSNAAQETNVVIDFDLQKMLQAMGLTMEQWQTMSPQEQASAREIYAKNQQQNLLNEQPGLGIKGLYVENNNTEPSNTSVQHDEVEESLNNNHDHRHGEKQTNNKDTNGFKWFFTIRDNKRQYLLQEMKKSEQFKNKNLTDEDYEKLLNEYITNKTKERLVADEYPPRFVNLSNKEWDALSQEKRIELINSEWENLEPKKQERFETKTINDYVFLIEQGISEEDYKNLSTLERLNLENIQKEQELKEINKMIARHNEEHKYSDGESCRPHKILDDIHKVVDEALLNDTKLYHDASNITCSIESNNNINIKDKYKNIVQGIEIKGDYKKNAEYLQKGIDAATAHLSEEEKQNETKKIIAAYLMSYTDQNDKSNRALALMQYLYTISNDPEESKQIIMQIVDDPDISDAICETVKKTGDKGVLSALAKVSVKLTETLERRLDSVRNNMSNFSRLHKEIANKGLELKDSNTTKILAGSDSELVVNAYVEATNNNEDKDNKIFGTSFYQCIQDINTKIDASANAYKGEDGDTQLKLQEAMGYDKYILIGQTAAIKNGDIKEEAQTPFAKNVRVNSEKTDSAVEIQKGLIDAIATGFTAENQKNAYEDIITNTSYVEVQEHAASSIYKLDESIREWAEQYTKSLGIDRVTNAIKTEPPTPSEKNTASDVSSTSYTSKAPEIIIQQDIVRDPIVNIKETQNQNNEETKKISLDFTKPEDREKFLKYFMQNTADMVKYLAKTSAKQKETFIVLLCNSSKQAAVNLAEQNPSFGILILRSPQIKANVQGAVANKMLEKYQKGHEAHTAALEYNNKFAIGKSNKKNEEEKGFLIRA